MLVHTPARPLPGGGSRLPLSHQGVGRFTAGTGVAGSDPSPNGERAGELRKMADHQPGSHLIGLIRSTIPPIHPGGRPIVIGAAAGTLGARFLLRAVGLKRTGNAVGRIGLAATAASATFFRAPIRVRPLADGAVIAPADGLVSLIEDAVPPPELGLDPTPRPRISIFLSIFDVHVQRIPIDGLITGIAYRPGAFLSADLDKASEDNERNSLVIESTDRRSDRRHPDRRADRQADRLRRDNRVRRCWPATPTG